MSDPTPSTASSAPVPVPTNSPVVSSSSIDLLKADIGRMMNYAIRSGKELPTNMALGDDQDETQWITNYNILRKAIAPTTVESIRYINSQMITADGTHKWYRIPIFSKCIIIAAVALVALIGISLSPLVNETNQAQGLLQSSGTTLFYNLIFICSASLLGVMFYLLKTYGLKIKNYTLLPSDAIELNASILIGVISGFVISELFSFTMKDIASDYVEIQKMTLALLGGFSSDAIFSILQGLVNKFKSLIGAGG